MTQGAQGQVTLSQCKSWTQGTQGQVTLYQRHHGSGIYQDLFTHHRLQGIDSSRLQGIPDSKLSDHTASERKMLILRIKIM